MRLLRWLTKNAAPLRRFILSSGVVAALWVGVLPHLGRQPEIRRYIDRNERLGIDPSAKFYTELPAIGVLMDKIECKGRRGRHAFWHRSGE